MVIAMNQDVVRDMEPVRDDRVETLVEVSVFLLALPIILLLLPALDVLVDGLLFFGL